MKIHRRPFLLLLFCLGFGVHLAGCAKKEPPAITEVEGTLLLDDKPLPFAQIDFVPELEDFGAEMNSTALTDEKGNFTMKLASGRPGAVVAKHRVIVNEGTPKELRGMDSNSQAKLAEYIAKLSNRPLPEQYGNYGKTPLRVEVKADQKTYVLRMKR